jgi:hypothetical protein
MCSFEQAGEVTVGALDYLDERGFGLEFLRTGRVRISSDEKCEIRLGWQSKNGIDYGSALSAGCASYEENF